jgi:hypothetical protein
MAAYEQEHGERILDLFDLHFYPKGVSLSRKPRFAQHVAKLFENACT